MAIFLQAMLQRAMSAGPSSLVEYRRETPMGAGGAPARKPASAPRLAASRMPSLSVTTAGFSDHRGEAGRNREVLEMARESGSEAD
jgi:hypothetical protein